MRCALILMAQFQIWDALITHVFVNNGITSESNPVVCSLISGGDFLIFKIIGVLISIMLLWTIYKYFPKLAFITAISIVVIYTAIITWNFSVILCI